VALETTIGELQLSNGISLVQPSLEGAPAIEGRGMTVEGLQIPRFARDDNPEI
jgi:hypothetical protein